MSDVPHVRARGLRMRSVDVALDDRPVIRGAELDAPAAAVTALVGPNGAGKSTLLRSLVGAPPPTAGSAALDGADLGALRRRERARRVALVEQDASTEWDLTVRQVVELGRIPHATASVGAVLGGADPEGRRAVEDAIAATGIDALRDRIVTRLSGGERQRVLLARALAQLRTTTETSALLLLDEPTNHLDIAAQLELLALLRRTADAGVTVIAALHDLGLAAAHADHIVVLRDGRVVAAGDPVETLTPALLAQVWGVRAEWTTNPLTGRPLLATASAPAG